MKFKFFGKVVGLSFAFAFALLSFSCQSAKNQEPVLAPTPREAYRLLYEAVKDKDTDRIERLMSDNTMTFAGFAAEQQKKSLEDMFKNGLTATTFADSLPESRDERVNGKFAALEVYSQKDSHWEDIPFILEKGGWKLAVGDAFKGDYKSPGKGQAQLEMEANNPMTVAETPAANANANVKLKDNKTLSPKDRVKKALSDTIEVPDENSNGK